MASSSPTTSSISIADYFTVRDASGTAIYRPTCHYAYHPADDAVLSLHEMFGRAAKMQEKHHILDENEIVDGIDELGVLLFGHDNNAYWYGSQLSIEETRKLAPYQNATGLQVTSAVLGGMVWALENPNEGIVEADEMDFDRLLEIQMPYLGPVKGFYTDWTPLTDRPGLFPEDIDTSDPWQFRNVLVIGKGTLPMIERHLDYDKSRITVIDPKDEGRKAHCEKHNVRFIQQGVTRDNYRELLTPLLTEGGGQGFCVNLSVDTGSTDIMELCNELGALYIDTVNEPWLGFYFDSSKGPEARSNYALREATLAAKKARPAGSTTAVSCCGANPGMVSFFVKQALLNVAADLKLNAPKPKTKAEWADLMRQAGVKGIHIAERDTQRSKSPKEPDVFVNTWSVEGFLSEGVQPSELGWGTHEKWMPENAHTHEAGCGAAIYLMQPGANTRVRTWCPTRGAQYGFLVTHNEFDLDRRLLHGA